MKTLFNLPTNYEWVSFGIYFSFLVSGVALAEFLQKKNILTTELTRKLVHLFVGVVVSTIPYFFNSGVPALILASIFIILNYFSTKAKMFKGMHGVERETFGTTYFPLAFLILIILFWQKHPFIISVSMLVLAFSDTMAAMVGEKLKVKNEYNLTGSKKSFEGSVAFFVTTIIVLYCGLKIWFPDFNINGFYFWLIIILISFFATSWEAISSKGLDNLFIPLAIGFSLYNLTYGSLWYFIDGNLLGIIIAYFSYRLKLLTASGSVAVYLLASIIYSIGGWMWTMPIFVFFILSSLISKIGKSKRAKLNSIYEKNDVRDVYQVLANGAIAGVIAICSYLFPSYKWYILYLSAIAVVTNDTWGTEIGGLSKKNPRMIFTFKKVESGTSGAVSILGTVGGAIGGIIIILVGNYFVELNYKIASIIFIVGILGSLIDSIMGATIQMQFVCNTCKKQTERENHCGSKTLKISGIDGINNDAVNLLSTLFAVFIAVSIL